MGSRSSDSDVPLQNVVGAEQLYQDPRNPNQNLNQAPVFVQPAYYPAAQPGVFVTAQQQQAAYPVPAYGAAYGGANGATYVAAYPQQAVGAYPQQAVGGYAYPYPQAAFPPGTFPSQPEEAPHIAIPVGSSNETLSQTPQTPHLGSGPPSPHHGRHGQGKFGQQDWDVPPEKLLTADLDISVRHGFIQKVYGILFFQLAITFGISMIFNLCEPAAVWINDNSWLFVILAIGLMCLVCGLVCVPGAARKTPTNYILLSLISVFMGGMLGYATSCVSTWAFTCAAGMTTIVVLAVSIFAMQTKIDFTSCWAFGFISILILMLFGIIAGICNNYVLDIVYASLGCLVFSFYIIFDTQKIVGGKHRKFEYGIDDYCFAALSLYLDIINLFSYMLLAFSAADH